jgi:hypothetical protein
MSEIVIPNLAYSTATVVLEKHRDNQKQQTKKVKKSLGAAPRLTIDNVAPEIAKLVANQAYETKHLGMWHRLLRISCESSIDQDAQMPSSLSPSSFRKT